MSKKEVRAEAAEPYSEQTSLGGPIPIVMGTGPMACKLKLSSKILEASGLRANDRIEMIAGENEIVIRKTGEPTPGLPIKGCSIAKTQMLDCLMAETRAFEAEQKAARERLMAYREEIAAEPEEPLDEEQRRREEL